MQKLADPLSCDRETSSCHRIRFRSEEMVGRISGASRMRQRWGHRGRGCREREGSVGPLVRACGSSIAARGQGVGTGVAVSRRFPVCNARQIGKVLQENGFVLAGQRGSHQKWRHANGRQVIVAGHGPSRFRLAHLRASSKGVASTWNCFASERARAIVWPASGALALQLPSQRPKLHSHVGFAD